ncbi:hypothetical protein P3X46_032929 [Hevea brasiliensis]|uniref:TPX2 C-terminal domain-containing protein n=1 Tax=Hevea brasiliensis TaxID=3981 RepID=A0ABQ9KEU3_HEVBR|nr:protein WVD2-like 7 [Hevea brasiliensis]XP_057996681.1 protein WVD2-like 7 [Hevea brasiliensis]KAJ9135793.1 hypothetical protein P3X46_032929 [Hevea brasiliensis]
MAGEFEEPYGISFQTDSLHSGSISFGRFESEDLSWERRSSFSHNRYLDEVEKYSKPGSVIQKKAYFEAHFKKKGMQLPGSLEGQNGIEYHGKNAVFENVGHKEDDDNANGSSNYPQSEEVAHKNVEYTKFNDGYTRSQFDHANSSRQYAHFGESPEGSEYHGEYEVMVGEREDPELLSSESQMEAALANANVLVEGVFEDIKPLEAHQTETGSDNNDRQEIVTKENLNDNAAKVDRSSRPIDPSLNCGTIGSDKTTAVHQQNLSPKVGAPMEGKCGKPGLKSQANTSEVHKRNHNDTSKTTTKKLNRRERESSQRMKSEKNSPQAAIPTRCMLLRTLKGEDSEICNSRSNLANKSDREPKIKKVVESESSGSKKVEPRTRQSANRFKQTVSSDKPDTRTSTAAFNFRSDERAERRKEFYTKLEEKMHAKEAEMNQVQAKTQEKTEAEIKQFRKSLNFKATPMPSFYRAATPPDANGNKATSSKAKPAKIQQKSTSPDDGAASSSPLLSKSRNNHGVSGVKPVKTADLPESSRLTNCHAIEISEAGETLPTNSGNLPEAVVKNSDAGKDSDKVKDSNLQRKCQRMLVSKNLSVEGKPKMGNRRNSSEMMRKSVKGVGIGSGSGMGSVAVGVAS